MKLLNVFSLSAYALELRSIVSQGLDQERLPRVRWIRKALWVPGSSAADRLQWGR